ncbi:thiol:disulfide interchange protein DsbA/DsbL [Caldimonas tepidiphila]|uniref:thiol:disulfide interchange protein DsbA/DsbL n=1 Tax=Caldimonas tepidiphila TaxID=2315841 RepID=UPI000E5BC96C|nr:thiol:disulfide interchange protein DsbA/DsbL [Caldimonas tepidiphila]
MKRRDFSGWMAGTALLPAAGLLGALPARAQAPRAGTDYVVLSQPQAPGAPGKVEVLEFFWYGCPHCFRFEPMLEQWVKQLPADVSFRRVPVAFREEFVIHQRIYYALEAMGRLDDLHRKVFDAMHVDKNRLNTPEAAADLMAKNGVDRAKFLEVFNSFSVQSKVGQARKLAEAYRIDGVPALGINGRYWTSGSLAGSLERSLVVASQLIEQSRGKRG